MHTQDFRLQMGEVTVWFEFVLSSYCQCQCALYQQTLPQLITVKGETADVSLRSAESSTGKLRMSPLDQCTVSRLNRVTD